MKEFNYTLQDRLGIHARPAGEVTKLAAKYEAAIIVTRGEKQADAKRIMQLMSLGVKYEDTITVTFEGKDEEKAYEDVKAYFEKNL